MSPRFSRFRAVRRSPTDPNFVLLSVRGKKILIRIGEMAHALVFLQALETQFLGGEVEEASFCRTWVASIASTPFSGVGGQGGDRPGPD